MIDSAIAGRLRLPLIAAPMLHVSGLDLVRQACASGVIGAFPTINARTAEELGHWLAALGDAAREAGDAGRKVAPHCPNLIMRQARLADDLACLLQNPPELVITSVGSPAPAIAPLHDAGVKVFADVATLHHAERAIAAGADGLVLLAAGAGGQTGRMNPFAFVRAVRAIYGGTIVIAGGISDGHALWAARALGCDLAYMGTKFIATHESLASEDYRAMLVKSSLDDVALTKAFTGLETSILTPSILAAGIDPALLDAACTPAEALAVWGQKGERPGPKRWTDIWSAGHSVSGIDEIVGVAQLVDRTLAEYEAARSATAHH